MDRISGSEAVELVGRMVTAWPNMNEGVNYVGALAAVLKGYPRRVAEKCAHPSHGLARECRYKPTACDVVEWCDREMQGLQEIVDRDDFLRRQLADKQQGVDGDRKLLESRKQRPSLDELRAKWGKNWGLSETESESPRHEKLEARAAISRETAILQEYARLGLEPVYAGDMLVSPTLRKQIEDRRGT